MELRHVSAAGIVVVLLVAAFLLGRFTAPVFPAVKGELSPASAESIAVYPAALAGKKMVELGSLVMLLLPRGD